MIVSRTTRPGLAGLAILAFARRAALSRAAAERKKKKRKKNKIKIKTPARWP